MAGGGGAGGAGGGGVGDEKRAAQVERIADPYIYNVFVLLLCWVDVWHGDR